MSNIDPQKTQITNKMSHIDPLQKNHNTVN